MVMFAVSIILLRAGKGSESSMLKLSVGFLIGSPPTTLDDISLILEDYMLEIGDDSLLKCLILLMCVLWSTVLLKSVGIIAMLSIFISFAS